MYIYYIDIHKINREICKKERSTIYDKHKTYLCMNVCTYDMIRYDDCTQQCKF